MQYRHPTGARLALLSGHVALVGPEWMPLNERFHAEALAKGCQCDQTIIPSPPVIPATKPSPDAMANTDEQTVLRGALQRMIERGAEDDFTAAGMPNLNVLRKEAGVAFDKTLAYEIFHALKVEAGVASGPAPVAPADAEAA